MISIILSNSNIFAVLAEKIDFSESENLSNSSYLLLESIQNSQERSI